MKLWKIFMMAGAFVSLLLLSAGGIASAALYNGDIPETRFTVADTGEYVLVSNTDGRNSIYTKGDGGNYILPNVLGGRISSQTAAGIKLFLQLIK